MRNAKERENQFSFTHCHDTIPGQLETSEAEKSIRHELYAHEYKVFGHVESREAEKSFWIKRAEGIHHGGGCIGTVYRLVDIGLLGMAISGSMIFLRFRREQKRLNDSC